MTAHNFNKSSAPYKPYPADVQQVVDHLSDVSKALDAFPDDYAPENNIAFIQNLAALYYVMSSLKVLDDLEFTAGKHFMPSPDGYEVCYGMMEDAIHSKKYKKLDSMFPFEDNAVDVAAFAHMAEVFDAFHRYHLMLGMELPVTHDLQNGLMALRAQAVAYLDNIYDSLQACGSHQAAEAVALVRNCEAERHASIEFMPDTAATVLQGIAEFFGNPTQKTPSVVSMARIFEMRITQMKGAQEKGHGDLGFHDRSPRFG